MAVIKKEKYHSRVKHISIQLHFVKEQLEEKRVKFVYVSTSSQVADALTKAVPMDKLGFCRDHMGLSEVEVSAK